MCHAVHDTLGIELPSAEEAGGIDAQEMEYIAVISPYDFLPKPAGFRNVEMRNNALNLFKKERCEMKRALLFFVSVVCIAAAGFGYAFADGVVQPAQQAAAEVQYCKITPQEAKKRIARNSNIVIVDVRTQEEYAQGHIPKAILLPVDQIEAASAQVGKVLPDKNAEIFVYCRSGKRAGRAAQALSAQGYTNVCSIGGIMDWPYETVK